MTNIEMMKAIVVDNVGNVIWREVSLPPCGNQEVLVEVHSTAVNRADLLQREGKYPPPTGASPYIGLEMAGTVRQTGEETNKFKVGDRVCGLLSGGGYAEVVAIPEDHLIPIPKDWNFDYAAAIPEVFLTAYVNLFLEANLQPGETVLIHGGASGVGCAAIQLARASACRVITTAGTQEKIDKCISLGAELALNYRTKDFSECIIDNYGGVDVILDINGADYLSKNIKLLRTNGRLVFIAVLSGTEAELDIGSVLSKKLRLIGSTLRNRSISEKTTIINSFKARFWKLFLKGSIKPVIDTIMPIRQVDDAHKLLAQNRTIGKVILKVKNEGEKK